MRHEQAQSTSGLTRTNLFPKRLRVLYKVRGRNVGQMRAIELMRAREAWSALVRVLLWNAACDDPADIRRVYMPCSTAADVERARHLCTTHWPEGRGAFIHASTRLPEGFAERPNDVWTAYDVVCINTTLKVTVTMLMTMESLSSLLVCFCFFLSLCQVLSM